MNITKPLAELTTQEFNDLMKSIEADPRQGLAYDDVASTEYDESPLTLTEAEDVYSYRAEFFDYAIENGLYDVPAIDLL